ncbi:hypothetical protein K504DRAFT_382113 [Pleomassaria siparia CBS 279.74]|uniref:WDR59/RTC1-like RING zinc finger domain-containing protein n=1 Tax=Pleomassaria siparia CBS 279.74 TaxID=1314801 RepID=A0A6G1K5X4_9PLEO|nr:hypothetical protein K504DRAFT_382113 [Pleomassaria siparia CBS 279.74]
MATGSAAGGPASPFDSLTFEKDVSIFVDDEIGAASISPSGRDVVLASKTGLRIIDLDYPQELPRVIINRSPWDVADVQWSPFASRANWVASTYNQKAIIYNLSMMQNANKAPIEYTLHAHSRAITDINFSAHYPDILATCGVDSYVYTWDLRTAGKPAQALQNDIKSTLSSFAHFEAGATQVKWNRIDEHLLASSHDRDLYIWDLRRGAVPLTTIKAHGTKIYGIDWSRSNRSNILTCSLDKTIKLWEGIAINDNIQVPRHTIHTDYPVWRARHTPFPRGILAMPKRGSSDLNLYTNTPDTQGDMSQITKPAHSFQAHATDHQVREFLWRSRGSVDDGLDNREYQLVSWGTDKYLHMHSIKSDLLSKAVGYEKGSKVVAEPSITRRGAKYLTYRYDPPVTPQLLNVVANTRQRGHLTSLLQHGRVAENPNVNHRPTMTVGPVRQAESRIVNHLEWMDGVKIGERNVTNVNERKVTPVPKIDNRYYSLAEEIDDCKRYFETIVFFRVTDIDGRHVRIFLQGPWGARSSDTRQPAGLWLTIDFPFEYPNAHHRMIIKLDTTQQVDDETHEQLDSDFLMISHWYAMRGLSCLHTVLNYALGRNNLKESLTIPEDPEHGDQNVSQPEKDESSSEDDLEGNENDALTDLMNSSQSNANIPLPIQCSARFSANGILVITRAPHSITRSLMISPIRLSKHSRNGPNKRPVFESLGRLPPAQYNGDTTGHDSNESESPTGSWESSSAPSSSESDNEAGLRMSRFQPPSAWQKPYSRYPAKAPFPSSIHSAKPEKPKSVISILGPSVEELIPSEKRLALGYKMFGHGPQVCAHNAGIARSFGYNDLADIWELCKLILNNEVPLEILPQQQRREHVLVLARRALVRIKRKDSGLDLQFDEASTVNNPRLKGRIKWGHHSIVTWLIPSLFDHFERLADTQMLAMLSCVFSEPATREGVTNAMAKMRQSNLPMSMEAPAFSLDYFPSADVAWSLFKPTTSGPSTPAYSRYAIPVNDIGYRLTKALDTYGSHGSSNGPWGRDTLHSEPVTPYSTGNTPPNLSRAPTFRSVTTSHTNTPYSTSPEQSQTAKKHSTTNFASAFASISRPFATVLSTSPSTKTRTDDLSTSAPTNSVTWGATTFYGSGGNDRTSLAAPSRTKHGKRASFGQVDQVNIDYYSDSDSDDNDATSALERVPEYAAPSTPKEEEEEEEEGGNVQVTLKNQDKFDDEACASAPLLDGRKGWLYRAWREQYAEMLGCWGLVSERAEVLKFNGLVSYFPPGGSGAGSKTGSISLALKKDDSSRDTSTPPSQSVSRASTLAPPYTFDLMRRSPTNSPRHFSFNPEAIEFTPRSPFSPEILPQTPNIFVSDEQYLRLSIPAISMDAPDNIIGGEMSFDTSVESRVNLQPRPSLSRGASNVSGGSLQPGTASSNNNGKKKKTRIHSCSICWIKVCGRFHICLACGHVAHFNCLDEGLGYDEGECVVGCGCGCGFEEDEDEKRAEMVRSFRNWEERGGWMPDDVEDVGVYSHEGSLVGEVGRWSEDVAKKNTEQKIGYRGRTKGKGKKKAQG